ncbi:MAG TPA: pyrogallol hydroxytransferase large subunit, partial [Rhodospirillales bacterium]|nr:pyrogallol hydroxytransferase large subunit [Rhodospirillales bacterium]
MGSLMFSLMLFGLRLLIWMQALRYQAFRDRLKEKNFTAQMKTKDNSVGRWFKFQDGKVSSGSGVKADADIALTFKTSEIAVRLLMPPIDQLEQINAMKDFLLSLEGPDELTSWFTQTVMMTQTVGWKYGVDMGGSITRFANMTNGGPVFLYVKNNKLIRITPIDFDDNDPEPWTIKARGKTFKPPRKTTLAPHGMNWKSMLNSPDRLLYPMKRVDFDPNGERNPQNRGIS